MLLQDSFWYFAGLLSGVALTLLLRSLWTRLAAGARWGRSLQAAAIGIVTVAIAVFAYRQLGSPNALQSSADTPPHVTAKPAAGAAPAPTGSIESVTASLEARLRQNGGSDADWQLLAQSYEFMKQDAAAALARKHQLPAPGALTAAAAPAPTSVSQPRLTAEGQKLLAAAEAARRQRNYKSAIETYGRLVTLGQMTADAWADYADATASLNRNQLAGEPERYLQQALQLNPAHQKALWLQGSVEHETGRHAAAVATWKKLLSLMPAGSSDARLIEGNIQEDSRLAAGVAAPSGVAAATANGVVVRGEVTMADALKARVKDGMTLYIVAKSVNSPGPPVAVVRTTTSQWPLRFELTDAMAMMPGRNLSSAGDITVEARISLSGQANPAAGDLLGSTGAMKAAGSKPLRIVISKVIG